MAQHWCLPAVPNGKPKTLRPTPRNAAVALRVAAKVPGVRAAPVEELRAVPSPAWYKCTQSYLLEILTN